MIFITAFITGLLGSFHCVGMCGPIALALPVTGNSWQQKTLSRLLYNLGRIFTYAIMGALLGTFGLGLKLAGWQQGISIAAGVLIILMVIFPAHKIEKRFGNPFHLLRGNAIKRLFESRSYSSVFIIGLLNGLLPCGFVYIALIGATAMQQTWQGALFMILFGLGTLPLMFTISMAGQFISLKTRSYINKWIPAFAILIACLFIVRGLNLGIPYISPQVSNDKAVVKECCLPE